MNIQITEKELQKLRRLGIRLSSYRSVIDEMLAILAELEKRHNAVTPVKSGKRKNLKEERKEYYRRKLREKAN
jgi:hypothetical protein